jgi:hypothetical protein
MTIREFNELKKKFFIYDDIENVIEFVSELLNKVARELEEKEPYATYSISKLDSAAYEVWNLLDYINDLKENN